LPGAEAVGESGRDLQRRRRGKAPRAADRHPIRPRIVERDAGKIAHHVRQDVGARIADLVEQLLAHREAGDDSRRSRGLRQRETSIGGDLGQRVADLRDVARLAPVGEIAAGGLGPAFDEVAGERTGGQQVVVVRLPAEGVDAAGERERAVGAAAGNHDVRTFAQSLCDRERAEIGVDGLHRGGVGKRVAREHLAHAGRCKFCCARQEIVALHNGDLKRKALCGDQFAHRRSAGARIDAARVRHDPHAASGDLADVGSQGGADEIGSIAGRRIPRAGARHDRERHLGQIVVDEVVELLRAQKLARRMGRLAPEPARPADDDVAAHAPPPPERP